MKKILDQYHFYRLTQVLQQPTFHFQIQALYKELETVVEKYNEAISVVNFSKEKIIALQGAIEALRSLQEENNIDAAIAVVDAA